jgi:hypothetical protein
LWKLVRAHRASGGVVQRARRGAPAPAGAVKEGSTFEEQAVVALQEEGAGSGHTLPDPNSPSSASYDDKSRDAAALVEMQRLCVAGERIRACRVGIASRLWAHALVLACGDPQLHQEVTKEFAASAVAQECPMQTLYLLYGGQVQSLFQKPDFVRQWKRSVALMLSNPTPTDQAVLVRLGDTLWAKSTDTLGAHICYLLAGARLEALASPKARVVLLGGDHRLRTKPFAHPTVLQMTEIFEVAQHQDAQPQSQAYRFVYACQLAELGLHEEVLSSHTHTHTDTRTHNIHKIHTHNTYTQTHTYKHTHTHTHTNAHSHLHTQTHTNTHSHLLTYTHVCTHTRP